LISAQHSEVRISFDKRNVGKAEGFSHHPRIERSCPNSR
jgi:hypothetical protein